MLLVIDVGNTNTVIGVFDGDELIQNWRIRTERNTTEDEFSVLAANLFGRSCIDITKIEKTVVSCVVPPDGDDPGRLRTQISQACRPLDRRQILSRHAYSLQQSQRSGCRPHRKRRRRL